MEISYQLGRKNVSAESTFLAAGHGATAGPRSSIKTTTVMQRKAAKSQRESMSQKLRLFLIHRRAATSKPRSKGR
jgi:hypothetical protein